eukprot:7788852-Pyramimonas_sp.AAC.2
MAGDSRSSSTSGWAEALPAELLHNVLAALTTREYHAINNDMDVEHHRDEEDFGGIVPPTHYWSSKEFK